jgi:hypothetical protein
MFWRSGNKQRALTVAAAMSFSQLVARAQEPQQDDRPVTSVDRISQDTRDASAQPAPSQMPAQAADGRRRNGLPLEAYAVVPGTRVLVRLDDDLDTGVTRQGQQFRARTLEPMEAGSGIYLPAGAELRGHVSRVDPAGIAGRAKIWLVFDEIRTKFGTLPIVADVVGAPGDHSVRSGGPEKEGMLESRTSTQQAAGEAAAEGAGKGALRGIKDKNAKEAAEYAAVGALEAYLVESGRGHEMSLPKGSKLELELERALYLVRE